MRTWTPKEIKELRKKHKLTQHSLSILLGVSANYIYLLESEVRKPSKTLCLLLDYVEKNLNENEKGKEGKKDGKRTLQKR